MSTPSMAPGKWSISPEWVTGESTSEGFGAGYSSESYYFYSKKKQAPVKEPEAKPTVDSIGELYVKYIASLYKVKP